MFRREGAAQICIITFADILGSQASWRPATTSLVRFPQFQGKVLNKKLQIPLPNDFFFD